MKTVLLISPSGARYFRRVKTTWQAVDQPEHNDRLWVIANLPEETLEALKLPALLGQDRSNYLTRRLATAFPRCQYRAATVLFGSPLKPSTAILTGFTTAEAVSSRIDKLDMTIAGVWGMSMLLTLMAKRLALKNVVLCIPVANYLRILVLKDGIPVVTRCIHRYSEDSDRENNGDASEILRTRQHIENRHIFEHDAIPPILYLGDATSIAVHINRAGLTLMPLPDAFAPGGEAAYLHPLFEFVVSSPAGQLAPIQLRARHVAENIRKIAYAGIAISLIAAVLFGQQDFRALIDLHNHESDLSDNQLLASTERERLTDRISQTGLDPALVRQATRFSDLEMAPAPTPEAILRLAASIISGMPQVRIRSLTYRFPKLGERYCQGHSVIALPLIDGSKPASSDDEPARHTELQFTILLTEKQAPAALIEIRKRITASIKANEGIQLMEDPAAFSLINTLKGGVGLDTTQADNLWCMSVPWKPVPAKELP
ncbi:MAG: hypothetical protein PHP85_04910 [Gallionella sp.]|nr:hypothetical protein [Gallionella sp.]